ncbi:MAG: hypothetical protein AB7L09_22235 [Nitrospira sp.]
MRKTDVLVYTGGATSWEITREQWVAAGVTDQGSIRFDRRNQKRIRVSDLSDAALEVLMDRHGNEFRVVDTGPKHNASATNGAK